MIIHERRSRENPRVLSTACSVILARTVSKMEFAIRPTIARAQAQPIHLENRISSNNSNAVLAKKPFPAGLSRVGVRLESLIY